MISGRLESIALLAIAALMLALHALAMRWPGALWGAHCFAFIPVGFALAAAALTLAAALPVLGSLGRTRQPAPSTPPPDPAEAAPTRFARGTTIAIGALAVAAAAALFWGLRTRHILLGDGIPLTARLAAGERFHALEPLTALIQHALFLIARAMGGPARPDYVVAWDAVAAGSAAAGALFVPVAWALAGELAVAPGAPRSRGRWSATRVMIAMILLAQGYAQLFFGYVENYTWYTLAVGLYLLLSVRWLRGAAPLILPGAALVLALTLHLSGGVLIPSFLVLAISGIARHGRRRAALRDLALTALLFALVGVALTRLAPGYGLGSTFLEVAKRALGQRDELVPGYLLTAPHLRDFLNEQVLIGPLPLPLLLVALATVARRRPAGATVVFAATAALSYLGASWMAGDSNLGYARNWDLLAPGAPVMLFAALLIFRERGAARPHDLAPLALALAISVAHTAPWIAVNASESLSLRRFATLPLGLGRTETTLGHWHAVRGRTAEAERWLTRALDLNPGNLRAHVFLGDLYLAEGRASLAVEAYGAAVRLRPDKREYRLGLASALTFAGRPGEARVEVERLLRAHSEEASLWGLDGILLALDGDPADGRVALGRASDRSRGAPVYARALVHLEQPGGPQRLRGDWLEMVDLARAALP